MFGLSLTSTVRELRQELSECIAPWRYTEMERDRDYWKVLYLNALKPKKPPTEDQILVRLMAADIAHRATSEAPPIVEGLTGDRIRKNVASHMSAWFALQPHGSVTKCSLELGMSQCSISNIACGHTGGSTITLYRIAAYIGVPLEVMVSTEAGK